MGLETVELILSWEEIFQVTIPDSDAVALDTPKKTIDYIWEKLSTAESTAAEIWTRDRVRQEVRSVVADYVGNEDFSDEAQFVRDLGLD